ncbi:MAG: hypothetical protein AVDCRST_MAG13-1222, partial [uncultured Solirubrobacteraceae bacterium]
PAQAPGRRARRSTAPARSSTAPSRTRARAPGSCSSSCAGAWTSSRAP